MRPRQGQPLVPGSQWGHCFSCGSLAMSSSACLFSSRAERRSWRSKSDGALRMSPSIIGQTLKGMFNSVLVEEDALTISYRALYYGFKGDKVIPYGSITSV